MRLKLYIVYNYCGLPISEYRSTDPSIPWQATEVTEEEYISITQNMRTP